MNKKIIASGLLIFSFISVFECSAATESLPYMKASDFTPYWEGKGDQKGVSPATVTSFLLKNQANQSLTHESMRGHISLVNFFFTSCGSVCPRLMSQVQKIQKNLSSNPGLHVYSISVTPDEDSPSRLRDYAKSRNINLNNWDLVTGDRDIIYQLGRGVFRADRNPDGTLSDSDFIHTQAIYLVDPNLHIRGLYQSDKPADMAALVSDVNKLSYFLNK